MMQQAMRRWWVEESEMIHIEAITDDLVMAIHEMQNVGWRGGFSQAGNWMLIPFGSRFRFNIIDDFSDVICFS